jgi:soluble lytic murein transglycosylase-like protein
MDNLRPSRQPPRVSKIQRRVDRPFVAEATGWKVEEIELLCRRSARRASNRRRLPRRRSPAAWRSVRATAIAFALLVLVAESAGLESSNAKAPSPKEAVATATAICPVPARFRPAFVSASEQTGVPVSLLVATAYEESRMNPAARSEAGARGLLQVMPATAQALRLGGGSPAADVLAGARYLRQMLDRFQSVELALAAYNAGPTAVARAGAAPTLATLRYVKNVEARAGLLTGCS